MGGNVDDSRSSKGTTVSGLPESLSSGATVLVAHPGDPTQDVVSLRLLCQYGKSDDTAIVVTTGESADQTIETFKRLQSETDPSSLQVVDTTSEQQSISALYGRTPVVFTPSPGDLERLVLALSDLFQNSPPLSGARHLVVRSLTPILKTASTDHVCTVLERITGLRSNTGLCLLGLDYTAHDDETMAELMTQTDCVLWTNRTSENHLEFEYRPTQGRRSPIS